MAPASIDEATTDSSGPALALSNATRKALIISARYPGRLVLAADTVVCLGRTFFGKPRDLNEALEMLRSLCGKVHEVTTGVCLMRDNLQLSFHETSRVKFRPESEVNLPAYLERIQPLDKAGGYAAQDDQGELIETIEGCRDNVAGLPLRRLMQALRKFPEKSAT